MLLSILNLKPFIIRITLSVTIGILLAVVVTHLAGAVSPGLHDNFQDGTTQGWTTGINHPSPPTNIPTGGPGGAGDRYLEVTSNGGFGPGSAPVTFNSSQWAGDYTAAGITNIQADMANFGMTPLAMRIAIQGGLTRYGSNTAVALPADGQWYRVSFDLTASDLTLISGTDPLATVLSNISTLRILSRSAGPGWEGDRIVTNLGIDNLTAGPVDYGNLGGTYGDAWHTLSANQLGSGVDPDIGAGGDSNDGVIRASNVLWQPANTVRLTVTVPTASGFLASWFDWNNDGTFANSERVISATITAAETPFNITIPNDYTTGSQVNARFRLYDTSPGNPEPTGVGIGGEVEDYTWSFSPTAVNLTNFSSEKPPQPQARLPVLILATILILGLLFRRRVPYTSK